MPRKIGLAKFKGCVEELLVSRELWIDHKKLIFFSLFVCFSLCKPSYWSRPKLSQTITKPYKAYTLGKRVKSPS
ncbi:hypothetical protein Taro_056130 [Colocasia esculenta]|uniref:Uncharacterized protein n=1 Tax=Colocasia esculenta TaxID=4460 RepID=A0A843XT38_COLES|nr:hypothetical protein [Colocasia esculenta]